MSVIIDGSAGVTTNAGGSVNPSTTIDGINYSCRAWVNFNGTGTVAIRGSGNVTSITDNGTGDYTVNFTTAMSDENYAITGSAVISTDSIALFFTPIFAAPTTSAARVYTTSSGFAAADTAYVQVAVFR